MEMLDFMNIETAFMTGSPEGSRPICTFDHPVKAL